jgi:anti-sigma-K factor RskA
MRSLRTALHVLTGVYAVDAIDDQAELRRFERHLRQCEPCVSEVRGMTETAARLGFSAAQPAPPGLRDRVLASVAHTRQLPPAIDHHRARPAARAIRLPRLGWVAAAASLVLIFVLVVALLQARDQLDQVRSRQAALAAVLAAPDARAVTASTSAGGRATVVYSLRNHSLIVTLAHLPSPPAGKVYELWLLGPPQVRPAGLLPAGTRGRSAPVLVAGLVSGDQLGLTVEPAGGTRRPTTTPILVLPLRA